MGNSLAWDKTVQTLDRVLSLAARPGHCPQATCPGSRMRLLSAQAQQMAPAGSTYGYDVLVRICALSDILATSPYNLANSRIMMAIEYTRRDFILLLVLYCLVFI